MRVKASAVGLAAEEYRHELASDAGWTGMAEVDVPAATVDRLYAEGAAVVPEASTCRCTPAWCCTAPPRPRSDGYCRTVRCG